MQLEVLYVLAGVFFVIAVGTLFYHSKHSDNLDMTPDYFKTLFPLGTFQKVENESKLSRRDNSPFLDSPILDTVEKGLQKTSKLFDKVGDVDERPRW